MENIYIVLSSIGTFAGSLIKIRGLMKFWNVHEGYEYSHASISLNNKFDEMKSFARRNPKNMFDSGLINENIREGMFQRNLDKSKIAIIRLEVTNEQYKILNGIIEKYWKKKELYNFNFLGLISMLIIADGIPNDYRFFCSEWIAKILKDSNINYFEDRETYNIKPFDYYEYLQDKIIFEGKIKDFIDNFTTYDYTDEDIIGLNEYVRERKLNASIKNS